MKPEFLQNFKVGDAPLPKEVIDAILAENGRDVEEAKKPFADYESIKAQLATATEGLKAFEGVDVKDLQGQVAKLTKDLSEQAEAHKQQLAGLAFDGVLKDAITAAKGRNVKAIRALLDVDKLKASKDQTADIKAALEGLKKDSGYLFDQFIALMAAERKERRRRTMPRKALALLRRLLEGLGLFRPGKIQYIGGSDPLPPPLSREEEAEVLVRLDAGEEESRQILIERNLRLVVYIARRFENTGINIEDLISIGTIGLIKSVNTYRTDRNIKLATYASRCIENEILMYLRKNAAQRGEVSLDEPLNTDWDGNELLLSDVLGTDSDTVMRPIEDDVDRQLLSAAIAKLEEREREIITLRFGLGGGREQTQKEVADRLGISQSYISRLEKRIISRLKKEILKMS